MLGLRFCYGIEKRRVILTFSSGSIVERRSSREAVKRRPPELFRASTSLTRDSLLGVELPLLYSDTSPEMAGHDFCGKVRSGSFQEELEEVPLLNCETGDADG